MFARSTTDRPVAQRVRSLIAAGLLALALMTGVAGTAATVSAQPPKKQSPVYCIFYTQEETILAFHFDPGEAGYWDCDFADVGQHR